MAKVLLGFMGVGKSTVAQYLDLTLIDMDQVIEERIGMSIKDYFDKEGEASFRAMESQVLEELIQLGDQVLIATGGGVVISEKNRALLRQNRKNNVHLVASFDRLYERISADQQSQRPLFLSRTKEEFFELFQQRMALYEGLADLVIDTDDRTPEEVARIIACM